MRGYYANAKLRCRRSAAAESATQDERWMQEFILPFQSKRSSSSIFDALAVTYTQVTTQYSCTDLEVRNLRVQFN